MFWPLSSGIWGGVGEVGVGNTVLRGRRRFISELSFISVVLGRKFT